MKDLRELEKYPQPYSTFFHEYLHFLQDISTTFGLMNAIMILNQIKYSNHYIINSEEPYTVPIPFESGPHMKLAIEMQKVYIGKSYGINFSRVCYVRKVDTDIYIPSPYEHYLDRIVVGIEFDDSYTKEIEFGGIGLIESMAHIAQVRFNPDTVHADMPYKIAEHVARFIYPEFAENQLFIFSLCDACLMSFHPAQLFFDVLTEFKRDGYLPTTEKDIYDHVYSIETNKDKNLIEHYKQLCNEAKTELTHYFTTDEFDNEKIWISTILDRASDWRIKHPTFMVDLLKQEQLRSDLFIQIILDLGSPLIENLDNDVHLFTPRGFENVPLRIDTFSAINEIFKHMVEGETKCSLQNYCNKSVVGDITDQRCSSSPWTRSKDKELCAYGILWKMWGLSEKFPN
ncbi:hypothetical protein [Ascidiimonas sp. W6]|uniref:hypothetical protein n=1 Tax=Ascidiimonas meishanensis TaxID=3128903 RepID=UPI0030EB194E